jgi:hypothetical protein
MCSHLALNQPPMAHLNTCPNVHYTLDLRHWHRHFLLTAILVDAYIILSDILLALCQASPAVVLVVFQHSFEGGLGLVLRVGLHHTQLWLICPGIREHVSCTERASVSHTDSHLVHIECLIEQIARWHSPP